MSNRRKKLRRFIVGISALLAALLLASCWYFRVWSKQDATAYYAMSREKFHPVWKALAFRRFGRGDPLKKLTDAYPPVRVEVFPPYKALRYNEGGDFNGIMVLAKDDVLMSAVAGSCTWERPFFSMSAAEQLKADQAYNNFTQDQMITVQSRWITKAKLEGRNVFIAGVGPGEYNRSAPLAVKVLEQRSGPVHAGEEIVIPPEKHFVNPGHIQHGTVILVERWEGKYESVPPEALQRANAASSP